MEVHVGALTLEPGFVNSEVCSVLRDTGSTICCVRKRLVSKDQYVGKSAKVICFGGKVDTFELADVKVDTPYLQGVIRCCVVDSPVVDLIIGNVPGIQLREPSKAEDPGGGANRTRTKHRRGRQSRKS